MNLTARKRLEAQAEHGDGQACLDLYEAYRQLPDCQAAREWLDRALDFNYPSAQYLEGVQNLSAGQVGEGIEFLKLAAENGNADAMNVLGQFYLGNITSLETADLNQELGIHYLVNAGLAGSVEAQIMLAKCFYKGKWVHKDDYLSRWWLEKAAEQGSHEAARLLDEVMLVRHILN